MKQKPIRKPQANFKQPPRKYQPRGLEILYEDRDILVANKAAGLLTVKTAKEKDRTARALLTNYVKKGNAKNRNSVYTVHRLDRDTSGVILFAKSFKAKEFLQEEWKKFTKTYVAVVHGQPRSAHGFITSHLAENKAYVMYSTNDPRKGKLAKTEYRVLRRSDRFSLLKVNLHTGRKNQIRVHMADEGCPVAGDEKYASEKFSNRGIRRLALHAAELVIQHPHSKDWLAFESPVPSEFEAMVDRR